MAYARPDESAKCGFSAVAIAQSRLGQCRGDVSLAVLDKQLRALTKSAMSRRPLTVNFMLLTLQHRCANK
jgi:hypothetical protein